MKFDDQEGEIKCQKFPSVLRIKLCSHVTDPCQFQCHQSCRAKKNHERSRSSIVSNIVPKTTYNCKNLIVSNIVHLSSVLTIIHFLQC